MNPERQRGNGKARTSITQVGSNLKQRSCMLILGTERHKHNPSGTSFASVRLGAQSTAAAVKPRRHGHELPPPSASPAPSHGPWLAGAQNRNAVGVNAGSTVGGP